VEFYCTNNTNLTPNHSCQLITKGRPSPHLVQIRLKEAGTIFVLQKLTIAVFPFSETGYTALSSSLKELQYNVFTIINPQQNVFMSEHKSMLRSKPKINIKHVSKGIPRRSHTLHDKCKLVQTVSPPTMEVLNVN
jgi:hypothetical protein